MTKPKTKPKAKRKLPNYFGPEYPDAWTGADQDAAEAEGWAIFERDSIGTLEIERTESDPPHEDAPSFEYDDDAVEHVRIRAAHGSVFHARALAIHQRYRSELLTIQVAASSGGGGVVDFLVLDEGDQIDAANDDLRRERMPMSRGDALIVLEQLKEALGNPEPIMGRLWWRADDLEELADHIKRVAKAGGRILSIDPGPTDISYIFEIDRATADKALGYHVEDDEWLVPDQWAVYCLNDDLKYVLATRRKFPDEGSARKYADTIAVNRKPRIRAIWED